MAKSKPKANHKSNSSNMLLPLVAIAVIVTVFAMMVSGFGPEKAAPTPKPMTDEQGIKFSQQGSSDETVDIEKDIKDTDFSKIDQGLTELEKDLSTY